MGDGCNPLAAFILGKGAFAASMDHGNRIIAPPIFCRQRFVAVALAFSWAKLYGFDWGCIDDAYTPLRQNYVPGFKLAVDLSQKAFPQIVFNQPIAKPSQWQLPLEHHHPVKDGKTYETADHDKGTAIAEHPITDTKPPAADLKTGPKADSLGGPSGKHRSKIIFVLL